MARFRRRKPRVVWLPPDPYNRIEFYNQAGQPITGPDQLAIGWAKVNMPSGGPGATQVTIVPLVADLPAAQDAVIGLGNFSAITAKPAYTLADMYDSGYRLRRIVGKIAWCQEQVVGSNDPQQGTPASNFMLTAGIIVLKSSTTGVPNDPAEGSPDFIQSQENPWVWRRSWICTNYAQVGALQGYYQTWGNISSENGAYNVREGGFIDQKTARVLNQDERLFMALQYSPIDGDASAISGIGVQVVWNLRFLASLKTNIGNRRNASR